MNRARLEVSDVKAAVSPGEFYSRELPDMPAPKRAGWVDGGLCQLHADRRPGSFYVNLTSGAFKCFSCGAAGGDVVAFLMLRDGLGFREALERLAEDWGVPTW
jgi:hypothetical protein